MKKENKTDDHHCSIIERERLKVELASCDSDHDTEDNRNKCHTAVKETSKKREHACKCS